MCIRFVTIRRIPKKECVCQMLQGSLRYLLVNSVQVAHEGASFVNRVGTLELKKWVEDWTSILQLQIMFKVS